MNALEIVAIVIVLPIGALFLIGGVALSLFGGWEDTPGVEVGHRPLPQPTPAPARVAAPASRPRMVVQPTAHAA